MKTNTPRDNIAVTLGTCTLAPDGLQQSRADHEERNPPIVAQGDQDWVRALLALHCLAHAWSCICLCTYMHVVMSRHMS